MIPGMTKLAELEEPDRDRHDENERLAEEHPEIVEEVYRNGCVDHGSSISLYDGGSICWLGLFRFFFSLRKQKSAARTSLSPIQYRFSGAIHEIPPKN